MERQIMGEKKYYLYNASIHQLRKEITYIPVIKLPKLNLYQMFLLRSRLWNMTFA